MVIADVDLQSGTLSLNRDFVVSLCNSSSGALCVRMQLLCLHVLHAPSIQCFCRLVEPCSTGNSSFPALAVAADEAQPLHRLPGTAVQLC